MNGNDNNIVKKIKKALGKCFTRRCRRVRRAIMGEENTHNSNNNNTRRTYEPTGRGRKRLSSMTQAEINALNAAAKLASDGLMEEHTGKTAAQRKREEELARMYSNMASYQGVNLFAPVPNAADIYFRELEREAREKREAVERQERELREAREKARRQREAEEAEARARRQREAEEAEARERARREREAEEERERARREREAEEARERARREREAEEARKKEAENEAPPPAINIERIGECRNLLMRKRIILANDEEPAITQKQFRRWVLQNHPDSRIRANPGLTQQQIKNITAEFQQVNDCFDIAIRPFLGGGRRKKTRRFKSSKRVNKASH